MSTISAFILIGKTHQDHGGIIPTHYIALYEGEHPSLSLFSFNGNKEIIRIKPVADKLIDNAYLLIHTFVFNAELISTEKMNGKEIHKLFNDRKESMTYEKIIENLKTVDLKVVFNIFAGSALLNQIDRIKDYPNDFEVTTPKFRKQYNYRTNEVEFLKF